VFIKLEKWFIVGIVVPVVIEPPSMTDTAQHPFLVRFIAPEADHTTFILQPIPGIGVYMIVRGQGSYEFIAVRSASLREIGSARKRKTDLFKSNSFSS
jgi:hypothetical protein